MHRTASLLVLALALPLAAHMVSISTGEARLEGARLTYDLRMPLFEASHLKRPDALLEAVRFAGARLIEGRCQPNPADETLRCSAVYNFPEPPKSLHIESRLHIVTVPNHVHVIRAGRGNERDQAVLELSAPSATIRFEPPAPFEVAAQHAAAGFFRLGAAPSLPLFLLALVVAGRSLRELIQLLAMFLLGQGAVAFAVSRMPWQASPRFIEAASALTVAYLAVEVLLLPKAGQRWLIVGVLGAFHGLALHAYLTEVSDGGVWFLSGLFTGELLLAALLWVIGRRAARWRTPLWLSHAPAVFLLAVALVWFGWLLY